MFAASTPVKFAASVPVAESTQVVPLTPQLSPHGHTQASALVLAATDGVVWLAALALFAPPASAWAVLSLMHLLILAGLGLYPGFGLMLHERLRRRWLATAFSMALAVFVLMIPAQQAIAVNLLFVVLAPLTEALSRHLAYRAGLWGTPAVIEGPEEPVRQNWFLGFIPAAHAAVRIKVYSDAGHTGPVPDTADYRLDAGGVITKRPSRRTWAERLLPPARKQNPNHLLWRSIKRLFDILAVLTLAPVAFTILLIVIPAIYLIDPGPVFFTQTRSGQYGRPTKIWKLRSMYKDSESRLAHILSTNPQAAQNWAQRFKLQPDPRWLPLIGWFIRKYSLDELPQLWNVLRGDLSMVGPRIFKDYDLEIYPPDLLKQRQDVPAGLTGLWQVGIRNAGSNLDKVRYDLAYVQNWSPWLDLDILYRTIGAVLTGRGAA